MESEQQVKFGLTLKQLRDLMDLRGSEAVSKIQELGGTKELCKKLNTSPVEGKLIVFSLLRQKNSNSKNDGWIEYRFITRNGIFSITIILY